MSAAGASPLNSASPKLRGTIIKVPNATPGIVFVDGQQKHFALDGVWKSPVAPAANQTVDVELDAAGAVAGIAVVDAHHASMEQFNHISAVAQERGKEAAKLAQEGVGALAARMGVLPLIVAVLVWVAWFFFPSANIGGMMTFSFWNLLGIDFNNATSTTGDHGLFSIVGIVALALPFAAPFVRAPWARYLNAAPFAFILIAAISLYMSENKAFGSFADSNPFSWGWGIFALLVIAAILALGALKKTSA